MEHIEEQIVDLEHNISKARDSIAENDKAVAVLVREFARDKVELHRQFEANKRGFGSRTASDQKSILVWQESLDVWKLKLLAEAHSDA